MASEVGKINVVELLLKHNANIDAAAEVSSMDEISLELQCDQIACLFNNYFPLNRMAEQH